MNYKAVYVEWVDSIASTPNWIDLEDSLDWCDTQGWKISQIGFVIKKTKQYLLLAGAVDIQENTKFNQLFKIPMGCVLLIKELTIPS